MTTPDPRQASIGIFDSGFGGLTVMRAIRELMPHENIIYFGDTARLPYGSKSPETILRYSLENAAFLRKARDQSPRRRLQHLLLSRPRPNPKSSLISPSSALQNRESKKSPAFFPMRKLESLPPELQSPQAFINSSSLPAAH